MDELKTAIQAANVQVIMLTATLPKKNEIELFQRLDINDTVQIFRDSTTRKNIVYRVLEADRSNYMNHVKQLITSFTDGRCIIYARTKELGEEIAEELHCDHYHSKADNKKTMFDRWALSDNIPVIAATSALGCGVDIPDIRYVIHVGCPGSLCDFAQESGRAGRDGRKSFSFLINVESMKFTIEDDDMKQYLATSHCRRCILDDAMDGNKERQFCATSEEICDLCEKRETQKIGDEMMVDIDDSFFYNDEDVQPSAQIQEAIEDVAIYLNEEERGQKKQKIENITKASITHSIQDLFHKFMESPCLVCALNNCVHCPDTKKHESLCRQARYRSFAFLKEFRAIGYTFPKYLVCYNCFCPQDICHKRPVKGVDCETKFVMLDVIYLISALDNSFHSTHLNNPKYMLQTIRNYAHYVETIQLVKIFMEKVSAYHKKNNIHST
jgi:hypothetical protein